MTVLLVLLFFSTVLGVDAVVVRVRRRRVHNEGIEHGGLVGLTFADGGEPISNKVKGK